MTWSGLIEERRPLCNTLRMPLSYEDVKDSPKQFLALTSLTHDEFLKLLAVFAPLMTEFALTHTSTGIYRERRLKNPEPASQLGLLSPPSHLLFMVLYYLKAAPIQEVLAATFGIDQPRANRLIHMILPIHNETLESMGVLPTQDGKKVANHPLAKHGLKPGQNPVLGLDATDRRRERPSKEPAQKQHYSGKRKAHSDKNTVISNIVTKEVVYVGATHPGSMHDKKCVDGEKVEFPEGSTVLQDTGYQGHAPEEAVSVQPKKSPEGRS